MVTVPAQCGYYCYYYYSYTYYTTRQLLLLLQQRLLLLFLQSFRWGYSWCRHWRHRWVDHYLCHCWLGVCQNLSITQPWSGLGVPSTARNLYQFKYTTSVPTNLGSGFFATNQFGRAASLCMYRIYCFERGCLHLLINKILTHIIFINEIVCEVKYVQYKSSFWVVLF